MSRAWSTSSFLVFNFFHIFSEAFLLVPGFEHLLSEHLPFKFAQLAFADGAIIVEFDHLLTLQLVQIAFIVLPLVESFILGNVDLLQVWVHRFGLDRLPTLAVGLLNVPDFVGVVWFVQQLLFFLTFPVSLLHPESTVFSLDTLFLFASSNDRLLVVVQLLLVFSTAINHLIL